MKTKLQLSKNVTMNKPDEKRQGMKVRTVVTGHEASEVNRMKITRLLNIFAGQQTQETLAQMAVEDGVSIFILASDDPDVIERFAAETIPAVREHVVRECS